jgi:hypothetical protein
MQEKMSVILNVTNGSKEKDENYIFAHTVGI